MHEPPLTGAQKSHLRGIGQTLEPHLKIGKEGLTPAFFAGMDSLLRSRELVKVRFVTGMDRAARASDCERIAREGRCTLVGTVGRTALFHRRRPGGTPP